MNWSSTVDAEFMCATINCFTADEVFLQLKASQAIGEDITKPFGLEDAQLRSLKSDKRFQWSLVLRKWHDNHNKGMEFRCYVKDGSLLGIVQKDDTASYEFLTSQELLKTVFERI